MLLISDIATKTRHCVIPLLFKEPDQIKHTHSARATRLIKPDQRRPKTTLNRVYGPVCPTNEKICILSIDRGQGHLDPFVQKKEKKRSYTTDY